MHTLGQKIMGGILRKVEFNMMKSDEIIDYINNNGITHWVNSVGGSRSVWFRLEIEKNPNIITHKPGDVYHQTPMFVAAHHAPLPVSATGVFCFRSDIRFVLASQIRRNIYRGNFLKLCHPDQHKFSYEAWLEVIYNHIINWYSDSPIDVWFINTDKIPENASLLKKQFGVSFDTYQPNLAKNNVAKELLPYKKQVDKINELLASLPSCDMIVKDKN